MNQTNDERALLSEFVAFLEKPEASAASLLWKKDDSLKELLVNTCAKMYRDIELLTKKHGHLLKKNGISRLSELDELYMGEPTRSIDAETIWGQIDLQNDALYQILKMSMNKLSRVANENSSEIRLLEDDESEVDDEEGEEDDENSATMSNDDNEETKIDHDTQLMEARMQRAMEDMEDGEMSNKNEECHNPNDTKNGDEESLVDPAAEDLNDGFFDINEMEAFADEEEEYLPDDAYGEENQEKEEREEKRSFHQKLRDGDIDEASDSDDDEEEALLLRKNSTIRRRRYREDEEIDALHAMYEKPNNEDDDDDDDVVNYTAADIFGKPNKRFFDKNYERWHRKKHDQQEDDDDSWAEFDFENPRKASGNQGWNDLEGDEDARSQDENDGLEDEDGSRDDEVPMKSEQTKNSYTKYAKQTEKLQNQTEQLEQEMLAEKPWQMTGETTSTSRPVNSLLDLTPEFERASKQAPIITIQYTANLEETVKKRILEEDWDDVVPRELPDVGWHQKRGELPEVSQEKSKLGLGELYEREYLKKAVGYDVEAAVKESEEEKAKNEMKALFANLCSKLDALSNYHFAPRPIADEAEVKVSSKPAIAMEEVLPLHVSEARTAAPEEIYATKRGRHGILRDESEMDQHDRKRRRASKKAARRKKRQEKLADEKIVSRLQPGLSLNNPYEKRKMREELASARARGKVTIGTADKNEYGASGTFFKRLQKEAEQSIQGKKGDDQSHTAEKSQRSSRALKL